MHKHCGTGKRVRAGMYMYVCECVLKFSIEGVILSLMWLIMWLIMQLSTVVWSQRCEDYTNTDYFLSYIVSARWSSSACVEQLNWIHICIRII